MKNNFILLFCLIVSSLSIAQEISDLNGIETQSGRTYLFYRQGSPTPYNSIYKLDTETLQDTIFLYGYVSWTPFGNTSRANNDFEFFPNDSVNFMNVGNEYDIDFWGTIRRNDTLSFSIPLDIFKVDISKQNYQKVYAGGDYNHLFRSFDGGYTFPIDSVLQFAFLSMSPFNDNIIFGIDSLKRLIKSFDGGHTSVLVDTSKIDDMFNTKFLYGSDQQHIYRINRSYGKYVLSISNNSGNQFSWTKIYESDYPIYISNDNSINGVIFFSKGRYIFKSTDYGFTFQLYKTFDKNVTGIYKKPNSDILYASTKYKIYKITPDTTLIVKSFTIPSDLFNYYPLKVGNKWIYNRKTVVDDFPPQVYYDTIIREVIGDSTASNNKKYFVVKEEKASGYTTYILERIDSTTGEVYRYFPNFNYPNEELLIDDLTLEVGETVKSFRIGYWMQDGFTVLREITNFTRWGSGNKRKIFQTYNLEMPVYSLTEGYGLDSSYYIFDFGYTIDLLRGCIIDGVVYGDTVLSVEKNEEIPTNFVLYQNYPNPFNPSTTISWQSPVGSWQTLKVFDILGREVATLVDEYREAGRYKIEFDASSLASGVYFYQLKADNYIETKKMMLIR
ncbi:T9SS type A sorting domain-containing protein [Ignavibacterium sp.]|uniref:T9SS type A sorting domain-containing protein n=1 Tax=Ignavibacterium sp. TaxID=2651167 RepID=UPI002206BB39|nr:T9SS type A sorting domain-containing protein [Ignavibacterium sp.]BDQ03247.1 MAG: hypothetical protein KatS3mg037_1822 [Ignavibacterium sp.]